MGAEGTLDVLGEIQALVSDKLQVVSYKWLSRNLSVSSNDAKRLLQDFVTKYGVGLEVIYALSGWLKENPEVYNIRLVPTSKLSEAEKGFREKCSVHVYSVQASIPKDPAAIWNAEFVQAEELFDQPLTLTNCLRDNRFCGVSNSSVERIVNGKSTVTEPVLTKKLDGYGACISSAKVRPIPENPNLGKEKADSSSIVNGKSTATEPVLTKKFDVSGACIASAKVRPIPENPNLGKEKDDSSSIREIKVEREKVNHGGGGKSLTNLWGRASAKSKPPEANDISRVSATSDGQISAQEALDSISSDDEWQVATQKESSASIGRKRRVVFDSSDEEDEVNAVDLSAPEPSNCQFKPVLKNIISGGNSGEVNADRKSTVDEAGGFCPEKSADSNRVDQAVKNVSSSPKKSKVLKTRIDERGREVTEVVWEGDAAEKKADVPAADSTSKDRRPAAAKSTPAVPRHVPAGKAGGGRTAKAGGAKDAKQPNILSFFKKT